MTIMESKVQHIQVPHPIAKSKVKIKDWLIYANIKRYMNRETRIAFPSIVTIAEHCNCSENLVRQAIKRLEQCGYIQVTTRRNQTNLYKFPELLEKFEMLFIIEVYAPFKIFVCIFADTLIKTNDIYMPHIIRILLFLLPCFVTPLQAQKSELGKNYSVRLIYKMLKYYKFISLLLIEFILTFKS